ncbi:hypothetical protein Q4494_07970 [Celeribacter halophilus]|uniref:Uncharacterized protein n=1 Tax=Celeribacter halophilus TaxID=576117 RepID=A0AAW7XUR2_9RHOB|nr:hypothetical protein [Celeribacter halophilus]MDO6457009.1 hypothetical protein [Celeribacter halophilus]
MKFPNLGNPSFQQILADISLGFAEGDHSLLIAETHAHPQRDQLQNTMPHR